MTGPLAGGTDTIGAPGVATGNGEAGGIWTLFVPSFGPTMARPRACNNKALSRITSGGSFVTGCRM